MKKIYKLTPIPTDVIYTTHPEHYDISMYTQSLVTGTIPTKVIIQLLQEELETANAHSSYEVYPKLYETLREIITDDEIDQVFTAIWNNGGLFE